jgi:hypothetical protein
MGMGGPVMTKTDIHVSATYHEFRYDVISGGGFPGTRWRLHAGTQIHESGGAFYDDEPDHPEGAIAWAEASVHRYIDGLYNMLGGLK